MIGPATAQRLAVTVGDRVGVAAGSDGNPATAHVVGIALFPEIDNGNLTDGIGYYRSAFADHATVPDLFEAFQLVVRVAPGQGERRHCQPDRPISWVRVGRERPRTSRQRREPARSARAALVARRIRRRVGAGITGARPRHHAGAPPTRAGDATQPRPDPRQMVGCIVWQAVTIAAAGLVIGVSLGLIAGNAAWWAVADPIGVRTDASRPVIGVIAVCAGALLAVMLVAIPVGRRANRRPAARALRVE